MAQLTNEETRVLGIALGNDTLAASIAAKINAGANPVAAIVAAIGATADLTALVPAASSLSDLSTGDVYTDASVNAIFAEVETALDLKADNADVEVLRGEIESRMDVIEAKIDEVIAALKAAGLMAS